jgi:hypothetical protein
MAAEDKKVKSIVAVIIFAGRMIIPLHSGTNLLRRKRAFS